MTEANNKKLWVLVIALCLSTVVAVKMINDRIGRDVQTITETPRYVPPVSVSPAGGSESHRKYNQKIVRRDRLSPGRDYIESIFYLNGMETARQKIINEKVVESSGAMPEGRVDFFDESKKTYGTEYYREGKRSGPSRTYFADSRLNVEAYYREGKLLWKREYYNDGGIRLEINYEDARDRADEKETGRGKVYYRDGTLKYEWHLTKSDKIGFKKSYNQNGELRAAFYFDENGQPME